MYKALFICSIGILLGSCSGTEEADNNKSSLELEDTVANHEILPENNVEEGPNEFEWIENVMTYEGKSPDSDISLALMINGVRDTLRLFTIWSFPEEVSENTKALYGFPANIVASKSSYDSNDFIAIQEKTEKQYDILYAEVSNDTVWVDTPIGSIENKDGLINYSIDFSGDYGSFFQYGETSPWPNFDE